MKKKTISQKLAFARLLSEMLDDRRLSKSDLARKIWGYKPDGSAQHRDRVSAWTRGLVFPDARNLDLLAQALGVTVADLEPPPPVRNGEMIEEVPGAPGRAFLMIAQEVPLWMAQEIRRMILSLD